MNASDGLIQDVTESFDATIYFQNGMKRTHVLASTFA